MQVSFVEGFVNNPHPFDLFCFSILSGLFKFSHFLDCSSSLLLSLWLLLSDDEKSDKEFEDCLLHFGFCLLLSVLEEFFSLLLHVFGFFLLFLFSSHFLV